MTDYTPTCPYYAEVEIVAWGEGLTAGLHTTGKRNDLNPYTSGDTCVAWAQGWDDATYKPSVFDFVAISDLPYEIRRYINVSVYLDRKADNRQIVSGIYLLWTWTGGTMYEADQPGWVKNRWQHRSIPLNRYDAQRMGATIVGTNHISPDQSIEMPCPPYDFDYSEGGMRISKGAYTKWGEKDDWQAVITSMQEALDDCPDTIDISDLYLTVDVQASASYSINVAASTLLGGENEFDGDMDELNQALEDALEQADSDDLEPEYGTDITVDPWSDVTAEYSCLSDDLDSIG